MSYIKNSFFIKEHVLCSAQTNSFSSKLNKVVQPNRARWHHISKAETQAIWQNLESEADKLRFILLRYLGLRAPSEMNLLTWECFCWETHTVLIRSPKTKGNADGGFRRCPFGHPDILPTLKKAFDARESDTSSVVPPIKHAPLTRKVQKWLGRAGLPIWPMLLQNFRRSAASDARTVLPAHIASAAFGHTEGVFNKHYAVHTQEQLNSFGKMSSLLS